MLTRTGKISSVLWLFLVAFLPESIGTEFPSDVTVSNGELALFNCSADSFQGIPRWQINGVTYHHNELPVDHWFNQSGLVVLADTSKNGWVYKCSIEWFQNGIKSTTPSNPATLTVTEGTTVASINVLRGPHVFGMHAVSASNSWTASWLSMPMTEGSYKLKYFACDQTSLAEITIPSSCVNTTVAGLGSSGNQLLEVQVCSADNVCGFQPLAAIATPGTIEPQNVVGVNYENNSFLPTENLIDLTLTQQESIFTSKLTSICDVTAIYFDVTSNAGVHRTYSAVQLIQSTVLSLPFQVDIVPGATNNIKLCTKTPGISMLNTLFGNANQVTIQERCLLRPCPTRNNLFVSYYGRKARIVITTPEVPPAGCSFSLNTMATTSSQMSVTSTPLPSSSSTIPAVTSNTPMVTTSLTEQSSSVIVSSTQVLPSSVPNDASLASPGTIAVIVVIILVILGALALYVIFGIVGSIYWRRKRQKWNPDCEGDNWSTNNSITASTTASSRNANEKYWTDA